MEKKLNKEISNLREQLYRVRRKQKNFHINHDSQKSQLAAGIKFKAEEKQCQKCESLENKKAELEEKLKKIEKESQNLTKRIHELE